MPDISTMALTTLRGVKYCPRFFCGIELRRNRSNTRDLNAGSICLSDPNSWKSLRTAWNKRPWSLLLGSKDRTIDDTSMVCGALGEQLLCLLYTSPSPRDRTR